MSRPIKDLTGQISFRSRRRRQLRRQTAGCGEAGEEDRGNAKGNRRTEEEAVTQPMIDFITTPNGILSLKIIDDIMTVEITDMSAAYTTRASIALDVCSVEKIGVAFTVMSVSMRKAEMEMRAQRKTNA